jgi:hypothetical protein
VEYTLEISEGNRAELCKNCMDNLINIIDEFPKIEECPIEEEI